MSGWLNDKNLNLNKRNKMTEYTIEQCLEQQKKVDAGIKHNGEYNPARAGVAEVVEMQEWLGLIKTWGENKIDKKQAFMELVDTKAFGMSAILINSTVEDALERIKRVDGVIDPNCFDAGELTDQLIDCFRSYDFDEALQCIDIICTNIFKRPATYIHYYYMGKQTLTRFRQDNGYKDGSYIKIWGEREDNEFLTDALEQGIEIDAVYEHLKSNYERIVIAKADIDG